jgi:hypothetical protein
MLPLILAPRANAEFATEWVTYEAPTPSLAARVFSSFKFAEEEAETLEEIGFSAPMNK